MKKLHFEVTINASPEKIWNAVVDDMKYREWASAFHEGSYFEGGWEKGDAIRFLALNDKGEKEGMVSEIAESRKYSFISIRHRGLFLGNVEDTTSEAARKWAPSYENYAFIPHGGSTKFEVTLDADENFAQMFSEMWPRALQLLKKVAENDA